MLNIKSLNIIVNFIDYILNEKRMSEHTVISYTKDIDDFFLYMNNNYDVDEVTSITTEMVRSWIAVQMDNKMAKTTVNRKISCIKSLFNFGIKRNILKKNPMEEITGLKKDKRLPTFLTEEELMKSIMEIEYTDDFDGARDKIIIEILGGTGIRCAEIIALKINSIDFESKQIKVRGKRDKERIIPINQYITGELRYYIKKREEQIRKLKTADDEGWLIITDKGEKSYPELIYRTVTEKLGKVTNKGKKSPHILRHTFATLLINNGADINSVKELLGHASLAATQIYTHTTIENMKKTYKAAHPRA